MPAIEVQLRRLTVLSSRPFEEIVRGLTAALGHPDMSDFHKAVVEATTVAELEHVVHEAIGSSGLMEFGRFDAGEVLRKERGGQPKLLRLLVGNPLIMKEMARRIPDAASYAPVTILVSERNDGVHLSFDSLASLLAPYGNEAALAVAMDLDAKVQSLLETAAGMSPRAEDSTGGWFVEDSQKQKRGRHADDANGGSGSNHVRQRCGSSRGERAASRNETHRSPASRSECPGTRGHPDHRRTRSRGKILQAYPSG